MPTVFLVDPAPPGDGPLYRLFHGAGYHVVQLATGEEALAAMVALRPDLVIVDAAAPAAGAAALAAEMRDDPRSHELPLIVLNARPDDRRLRALVGAENFFVAGGSTPLRDVLHHVTCQLARLRPPPPAQPPSTAPPLAG